MPSFSVKIASERRCAILVHSGHPVKLSSAKFYGALSLLCLGPDQAIGVLWECLGYFCIKVARNGKTARIKLNMSLHFFHVLLPRPGSAHLFGDGWLQQGFSKCETVLASQNVQEEILGSLSVNCMKPSEVLGSS